MAATTVRIHGLRELSRALKKAEGDLDKELRNELRDAGAIVQAEARARFAPLNPQSAEGYKVRVRGGAVAVEQSRRRTTGLRPDYGALQMAVALQPALEAKEGEVVRRLDRMLDEIGRDFDR